MVVMIEVAAFITTMNFLASSETWAAASAFGVSEKPSEDVDVIAGHQFLRQALGNIGSRASDILFYKFDFSAGDRVAMLFHVELDSVFDLYPGVGELTGIRHDQADLDGRISLREGGVRSQAGRHKSSTDAGIKPASCHVVTHCFLLVAFRPYFLGNGFFCSPLGP